LPDLRVKEDSTMAIRIVDDTMTLETGGRIVATAWFSEHAAANGNGARTVSTHPARLFSRNQAITALALAERLAVSYGDDDPFVTAWRKELFLWLRVTLCVDPHLIHVVRGGVLAKPCQLPPSDPASCAVPVSSQFRCRRQRAARSATTDAYGAGGGD
jgi:hypothetical protein